MTSFVDTSALLALLNVADEDHARVANALRGVEGAITHNYVVVETEALVDEVSFAFMRDKGLDTAVALDDDFVEEGFSTLP